MKVTLTSTSPHPQGLCLGLVVEGPKRSWIRFSTTVLLVNDLSLEEREWLTRLLDRLDEPAREEDEPLELWPQA
jgi:hypothetical protein